MKNFIINLVRKVFSIEELIDRLEDQINDMINYDDIAESILHQVNINDIIDHVVEEEVDTY